jgi:hypothetical protein
MVREPSAATTSILRQIQGTLADHGHRLDALEHLIQEVAGRLGEIRTGMMTVLGFVTHADNRHNELKARDRRPETTRRGTGREGLTQASRRSG